MKILPKNAPLIWKLPVGMHYFLGIPSLTFCPIWDAEHIWIFSTLASPCLSARKVVGTSETKLRWKHFRMKYISDYNFGIEEHFLAKKDNYHWKTRYLRVLAQLLTTEEIFLSIGVFKKIWKCWKAFVGREVNVSNTDNIATSFWQYSTYCCDSNFML